MIAEKELQNVKPPSKRKIAAAAAIALVVAAIVLVTTVLPAEYGIDLLGTGRALGLLALSEAADPAADPVAPAGGITRQAGEYKIDTITFTLAPFEWIEYKYRMEEGASMVFSWTSTRPIHYDFHSEPDGAAPGYAESFEMQENQSEGHGTYTAAFPGTHGWYFENPNEEQGLTITLTSAGFYSESTEFRHDGPRTYELTSLPQP